MPLTVDAANTPRADFPAILTAYTQGGMHMILVREVFSIDPDQMKEAKDLMREYRAMLTNMKHPMPKVMTDLVADHYTLVMETEFADMSAYRFA